MKTKWFVALLGGVLLLGLGALGYFVWQNYGKPSGTETPVTPLTAEEASRADLGTDIYMKTQNPVQDKLPETTAPVPNPIEDVYKNPFE